MLQRVRVLYVKKKRRPSPQEYLYIPSFQNSRYLDFVNVPLDFGTE